MRRLYLLRHAKSSWARPGLDDFERPLNARGREASPATGRRMRKAGLVPDLVLCSAARRAVETWEALAPSLGREPAVKLYRSLYLAAPARILETVRRAPDEAGAVLVIGHNPGMERLAAQLAGPGSDPEALAELTAKYPTAALAVFELDAGSWRDVELGACRLEAFLKPG